MLAANVSVALSGSGSLTVSLKFERTVQQKPASTAIGHRSHAFGRVLHYM